MIDFVKLNKSNIGTIINKYIENFEDVLCVNEHFLDLVFGPYGTAYIQVTVLENVDDDPNKKYFVDGTLLHILNKEASWDDMFDNTFIEGDLYDEFVGDIALIEEVFKMYLK